MESASNDLTGREFVGAAALSSGLAIAVPLAEAQTPTQEAGAVDCAITINGQRYQLSLDPRVTPLDLLRERLHLIGTKKGCDHGQCGTCTVLAGGVRINSCLSLALTHDGESITTIEGLEQNGELHAASRLHRIRRISVRILYARPDLLGRRSSQ